MNSIPIFIILSEYIRLNNMSLGEKKITDVINSQLIKHGKSFLVNFPEIGARTILFAYPQFFGKPGDIQISLPTN